MKNFKERNPLLIKMLAVLLLVLMCCNLPSLLFWPLCLKEDLFRPPNTEVLVSACKNPGVSGVPGGEVLFVHEGRTGKMYLLDLRTGEKRDVPNDPLLLDQGIFLSSELVWLYSGLGADPNDPNYRPNYILDLTNGQRYELTDLSSWIYRPAPPSYVPYFQSAEQVFIHHGYNRAIALPPNFRQNPQKGVILYEHQRNTEDGKSLEVIMKNLGKGYEIVDFSLHYADVLSPTGRYIVRDDGIYLLGTNIPVVTRDMVLYFRGWYSDESGVVLQEAGYHLIDFGAFGGRYYYIPGPVLKLRLPAP